MNKVKGLALLISLIVESGSVFSQFHDTKESTQSKRISYIKTAIFPALFESILDNYYLWLTLDYERQFKRDSRLTYNLVLDYRNFTSKLILGTTVYTFPDNIDFYVRPQLRYYTGKTPYKGYYVGVFPLYLYRDKPYVNIKGNYWGAGLVTGYQIFISRKYPLEFYFWVAWQTGRISTIDYTTLEPIHKQDTFIFGLIQLNIGLPITGHKHEKK